MTVLNKVRSRIKPIVASAICLVLLPMTAQAAPHSSQTPEGWMPHFESVATLAIVLMAVLIAALLNHAKPKVRAAGTALAALSCFGIVLWFSAALGTGVLDNPKPHQTPMDASKPALLWAQAMVAAFAGIALLFVANGQRKNGAVLDLSNVNEATRYGRVSRILHWTTAILFIFMIPTGIFAAMIPEGVWFRTEYNVMHKTIGITLFALVIARLLWNRRSKRPALDGSLKPAERKLAHGAHVILYGLMIAIPVSGYLMTSFHGYVSYFFMIEIKSFLPESDAYIISGLFHKYLLQYLVYLVLGAHILGALKHHFIDKHKDAFKRMVS